MVDPWPHPLSMYGNCMGTTVVLGNGKNRKELDLCDPKSISELVRYLKSDRHWKYANRSS